MKFYLNQEKMDAIRAGRAGDALVTFFPTHAHLARPTYLEISMANSLFSGFQRAIDFMYDNTIGEDKKYKKIFDALFSLMELHAVSVDSATLGERYMGLRRVGRDGKRSLGFLQKFCTILESSVVPFLLKRYESEERIKPYISAFKSLQGLFAILYLSGFLDYASPFHFLVGIRVTRSRRDGNGKSNTNRVLSSLIHGFVFLVQLAQWYYSHENILHAGNLRKKIYNPPQPVMPSAAMADPRLCRICRKIRTNPTALITSGEVFCYTCLVDRLRRQLPQEDYTKLIRRLVEGGS